MHAVSCGGSKFGAPLRYRVLPTGECLTGEIAQIKGAELVFFCDRALDVDTKISMVLPMRAQTIAGDAVLNMVCTGEVVRRILLNWPDVRPALAVHISSCHIAREASSDPAGSILSQALSGVKDESEPW